MYHPAHESYLMFTRPYKHFPKISIVLLNWNGKKDTLECLASIQKIDYPHFQAIVVDNGSSDDSVATFRSLYPDMPIIETHQNLGFAGGNNIGIEWVLRHGAEWIFLLNNDTTVAPDVIKGFFLALKDQPKAKILGAKILRYNTPDTIDHLGGMWVPHKAEFTSLESGEKDHPFLVSRQADYVCGAALFMHRSVPQTIGLLEPRYFLFWEETDYCYRAKKHGFEVWTAPKARVWHKVSSSFSGGKPHMHYFWWRSRLLWLERNCSDEERQLLYRKVIIPEIVKLIRHYLIKRLFSLFSKKNGEKLARYKAGCLGIWHYCRKKFGNCPEWLVKRKPVEKSR